MTRSLFTLFPTAELNLVLLIKTLEAAWKDEKDFLVVVKLFFTWCSNVQVRSLACSHLFRVTERVREEKFTESLVGWLHPLVLITN